MPIWNYNVLEIVKITEGAPQVGTVFRQKRPQDSFDYKIVEFTPLLKVVVEFLPPGPRQRYGFALEPEGLGTRIRYLWEVDLSQYKAMRFIPSGKFKNLLLWVADVHIQKKIRPATDLNFTKLKAVLENPVTLIHRRVNLP